MILFSSPNLLTSLLLQTIPHSLTQIEQVVPLLSTIRPTRLLPLTSQLQVQLPMHPTLHKAPFIGLPENSIRNRDSPSDINPYLGTNTGSGSNAIINTSGLHTMSRDVCATSGNPWQQHHDQLPVSRENMQTHVASEYFAGANETTGPVTLGASGDTNGDSRTRTISWQNIRVAGTQAQAQVVVTDEIRDPYVHTLLFADFSLRLRRVTSLWPTFLRLDINPAGISTTDIQRWIYRNHAPVARIKCASGTDKRHFNDLLESLRNCGGVSPRKVSANLILSRLNSTRL
jgi:hypothetical protein